MLTEKQFKSKLKKLFETDPETAKKRIAYLCYNATIPGKMPDYMIYGIIIGVKSIDYGKLEKWLKRQNGRFAHKISKAVDVKFVQMDCLGNKNIVFITCLCQDGEKRTFRLDTHPTCQRRKRLYIPGIEWETL